mgnify:CR=1 FL=1
MNTTDKNQFIEQIQNWQQADPENRTAFVVLIEQPISLTTEYAEDNTQRFSREIIIKPIN